MQPPAQAGGMFPPIGGLSIILSYLRWQDVGKGRISERGPGNGEGGGGCQGGTGPWRGESKKLTERGKIPHRRLALIAILIMIVLISSFFGHRFLLREDEEDWTVMIYMAGDNSLDPMVQHNLDSMMDIGSGDRLDIVALADSSGHQDSHLYHVKKGRLVDKGLKDIKIHSPGGWTRATRVPFGISGCGPSATILPITSCS